MPTLIHSHYEPTSETLYIRPAFSVNYDSYVKEFNQTVKVKQVPTQIISSACLDGGSTYEGRRKAVTHLAGIQSKIPIPINPRQALFAFPTHSPSALENIWIFFQNVHTYSAHQTNPTQSIIHFVNRETLTLPISYPTLEKQMHKTAYCVYRFSE